MRPQQHDPPLFYQLCDLCLQLAYCSELNSQSSSCSQCCVCVLVCLPPPHPLCSISQLVMQSLSSLSSPPRPMLFEYISMLVKQTTFGKRRCAGEQSWWGWCLQKETIHYSPIQMLLVHCGVKQTKATTENLFSRCTYPGSAGSVLY